MIRPVHKRAPPKLHGQYAGIRPPFHVGHKPETEIAAVQGFGNGRGLRRRLRLGCDARDLALVNQRRQKYNGQQHGHEGRQPAQKPETPGGRRGVTRRARLLYFTLRLLLFVRPRGRTFHRRGRFRGRGISRKGLHA